MEIDHYTILGLPSGEEGSTLTTKEITKAYRQQALLLHPDKNPNDPNSHAKFHQLQSSFQILKDDTARKLFDQLLSLRRDNALRDRHRDHKRRRMVSDLQDREKGSVGVDPDRERRWREERVKRKLDEEVRRVKEMMAKAKGVAGEGEGRGRENEGGERGVGLDKGRVLKVTWERSGEYGAARLRELFQEFGVVEDVVIKSSKNKGSALVVMGSREDVVAATGVLIGDLSNPLLVLPLQPVNLMPSVRAQEPVEREEPQIGNVVGAGYQAFENSVLEKFRMAAQKQNKTSEDV